MIRTALDRPISTSVGTISLVVLGIFALFRLPVALLPEVDRPVVQIEATVNGRSADELLSGLTIPLERRLASIDGVRSIRSTTDDGLVRVMLESDWQVDADRLQIEITRRAQDAGEIRPESVRITSVDVSDTPILEFAVTGGSAMARTEFVQNILLPELSRVPGAGRITTVGLTPFHVEIELSPVDLVAHGVTVEEVEQRLQHTGSTRAAGLVRHGASLRTIAMVEPVASLGSIAEIMVPTRTGDVPLGEIAEIRLSEDRSLGHFSIDGTPGVSVGIYRGPQSNVVALAAGAREAVSSIQDRLIHGLSVDLVVDRSREISIAIRDLGIAAIGGLFLGTFILRWMLGHWRTTLALSAVIPSSIFTAMIAFYVFGVPLDIVSISGLALAAGMLVDNSIVVADSIENQRERGVPDPEYEGTRRVVRPVIVSTLTTVMVFVPFMFLRGLARAFFGEQAFAVIVSVAASLLFSLTLTPLLCRRRSIMGEGRRIGLVRHGRLLDSLITRPRAVAATSVLIVIVTLLLSLGMKRELFPRSLESLVTAELEMPPSLTEEETAERFWRLEKKVRAATAAHEAVRQYSVSLQPAAGRETIRGRILLRLDESAEPGTVIAAIEDDLSVPGVRTEIRPGSGALLESLGTNHGMEIVATASDPARAAALAERIIDSLGRGSIIAESASHLDEPSLALEWDQQRMRQLSESSAALETQVASAFSELEIGRSDLEGARAPMRLSLPSGTDPRSVPLRLSSGEIAPLDSLAHLDWISRPRALERVSLKSAEILRIDDERADPFMIATLLEAVPLGSGEEVLLSGSALDLRQSFDDLGLALLLSLILVYLVLAAAYESLTIPPLIMITVPLAAGGAIVSLAITGQTLNLLSLIGIIVLGGIVVNNAVVLVDRAEQLRSGLGATEAARLAAAERYRPIVLTTLTTLCGMLPLALWGGEGVELRRALATSVVGGLVAALIASLLIVPVLYPLVRRSERG